MKTNRDNHLWLQLWRDKKITDFHQYSVNKYLSEFWSKLKLKKGSRVLVPLCGKTLDMIWLANEGFEVIGVEISPLAVKAFFHENRLIAKKKRQGKFMLWQFDKISILCGDYFSLNLADIGHIDAVYDRAALTALPESLRKQYVAQLALLAPQADVILLTIEDIENSNSLRHPMNVDEEISSIYAQSYEISLLHADIEIEDIDKTSNTSNCHTEFKVYRLVKSDIN